MTDRLTPLRRHAWLGFALAGLGLTLLWFLAPWASGVEGTSEGARRSLWVLIPALAIAAVLLGLVLHRPRDRRPWLAIAASLTLAWVADLIWEWPGAVGLTIGELESPSIPDALYFASYVALFVGVLLLVRARAPGRDRAAALDALIVAVAAALTTWVYLVQPVLDAGDLSRTTVIVTALYPVMDVMVLAAAARLFFATDSGRNISSRLIVLTLVTLLITDTIYSTGTIEGSWRAGNAWEVGWFLFYIGLGTAALHPSMASTSVATTADRSITRWRFVLLLSLTALLPLVLLLGEVELPSTAQGLVILVGALVMFGLVLLRLNDLVHRLWETARRERVIRDANAALAAAADLSTIRRIVVDAAADLVPDGASWMIGRREAVDRAIVSCSSRRGGQHRVLAADAVELLDRMTSSPELLAGPTTVHAALDIPTRHFLLAQPLHGPDQQTEGYVLLSSPTAPPNETASSLSALADAAVLAHGRIGLGRVLAERESDRRLGRMLQHSTDIIAVLGLDLTIRYLSPGAERLLGLSPRHAHGLSWLDVVFTGDRRKAQDLIGLAENDRPIQGELRLNAGDGSHRYVDLTAVHVTDDSDPGYVLTCHDITERRALEQQLSHQAFHDSLTGLANRSLFRDRLEHALTRASRGHFAFAVLFIDLDDFKVVNDSMGHATGDALLRKVTGRLVEAVREQDTVARLGGDEFAVLLESIDDDTEVFTIAQRIVDASHQPFVIDGMPHTIGVSVGVALTGDAELTAEDAMRNADLALYEAKALGKNRYAAFKPFMHEQAMDRLELTSDLRRSVPEHEILVHYQPIIDMRDGRTVAVEALARWHHPVRGLLAPDQFIAIAEETGLIVPVGEAVLRQALLTGAHWQRTMAGFSELGVTVNLSVRQLLHPGIVEQVAAAIEASRIDPSTVVLEITESVLMPDGGVSLTRLNELKDLGIHLYIDDFGTGYSSLSYLQQLPVDGIKLAREFVSTLGQAPIDINEHAGQRQQSAFGLVSTIRELARTFGLKSIIAEGVETPEQRDALLDLGYRLGQGFLMSRPMPANSMTLHLQDAQESAVALSRS